ncbi:LacI family DNA-binding transcriptional regulator [Saccharopolyspora thermophila]|uniref:LacI family DNA-binding transcriptional regulator n=1 Tax=Saccharopolyspora thermophila TaxID=89367 RepID=A0ABN1D8C9_9PSEU
MADKSLGMRGAKPRRPAIREVAQHAGVAVSSVSRVISGHPDVSDKMRERVLRAIEELGYVPDLAAQSIRTGATMTIGFPLSDIRNPLFSEIAHAAETRLEKRGYSLLMMSSLHDPDLEVEHLRRLQQRRVDGLLVSVTDEQHPETVRQLTAAGVPIVLVDRDISELSDASAARFDHAAGLTAAVEHLVALGHRSIGLVNGSPTVRPSRERARALREIASAAPDLRVQVVSGDFSSEHGAKQTYNLMNRPDRPTALIAGSNQILVGVLSALAELPVEVPRDVSLVTCDEVPMAAFVRPRLATIRRDVQEIGRLSADLLLAALDGQPARTVQLPTTFEPADSCTAPPTTT